MSKYLPTVARVLLGLIFVGASIAGLMGQTPPMRPAGQAYLGALFASGLLPVVKILELLCGLALLAGFFVPLATAILAPIIFNIAFYQITFDPEGIPVVVVLVVLWTAVVRRHRQVYAPLFRPRPGQP